MPYQPDQIAGLEQDLSALDPDLRLVPPEDPEYPAFLQKVSALDANVARRIDHAVLDEQAEATRALFENAGKKGNLGTALNKGVQKTKGTGARGQRRVRPTTFYWLLGGLVAGAVVITALMPEKNKTAATPPRQTGQETVAENGGQQTTPEEQPQTGAPVPTSSLDAASPSQDAAATTPTTPVDGSTTTAAPAPEPVQIDEPTPTPQPAATLPDTTAYDAYSPPVVAAPAPAPAPVPIDVPTSTPRPVPTPARPTPVAPTAVAAPTPLPPPAPVVIRTPALTPAPAPKAFTSQAREEATTAPRRALVTQGEGGAAGGAGAGAPRPAVVSSPSSVAAAGGIVAAQPADAPAQTPRAALVMSAPQAPVTPTTGLFSSSQGAAGGAAVERAFSSSSGEPATGGTREGLVGPGGTPEAAAPTRPSPADDRPGTSAPPAAGETGTPALASTSTAAQVPYTPGMRVNVVLDTAVAVYPGATHPVWARGEDGAYWRGQASLDERTQRINLRFDRVMQGSNQYRVSAYAESTDGPGFGGRAKQTSPNAARAALQAVLGGIQAFAQSQAARATTVTQSGLVVQQERPQNFWVAVGGALAGAFTPPEVRATYTVLGQMGSGEKFSLRVDVQDEP